MSTGLYGVLCMLAGFAIGVELTRRIINRHFIVQRRKP